MPWISTESTNRHDAYHTRECGAMQRIRPEHLRRVSKTEAVQQGKELCEQCQSMEDRNSG